MATSWVQRSCDFYAGRVKVYTRMADTQGEKERGRERENIYIHTAVNALCV